MSWFIILPALLVIAALVYLATLDGDYTVRRCLVIKAEKQAIFDKIRDFETWAEWSPWLLHEPDCVLTFSDTPSEIGGNYSWDGKFVGAGKLEHVRFDGNDHIEQKISFIRPFKSVCSVSWEFRKTDNGTEVCWQMNGHMPFLFRPMVKMTVAMIEKDYDLGLAMLNGVMDPSAEYPRIEFAGRETIESFQAITISFQGDLEAMQKAMQEGFPRLGDEAARLGTANKAPLTIYHKVDPKKMYFECDMAVPLSAAPSDSEFAFKSFPGGTYFKVVLRGDYRFLELAWYSAMSHCRMHKLKANFKRASLEIYVNEPCEVESSNDIETRIMIPLKS